MTEQEREIQRVLAKLRTAVRRYIVLEGLGLVIALACFLFWVTYGIDYVHFQMRRLELPATFRLLSTITISVALISVIVGWMLARLMRPLKPTDLALAVERRHPQLQDRLITAIEYSGHASSSPLQERMIEATAAEAAREASALDVSDTLNRVPLHRVLTVAGVLLASVLVFGIANAQGMERWYRAYILGRSDYWEPFRQNALKVNVIAQPGDRVREFDQRHVYKHPRGEDLVLVAKSLEEAVPPDRALLQFISFGGAGRQQGKITMSRVGEMEFRQTLSRVVDDHQLWIYAGDYVNRSPFRIQVVDPPRVDSINLECDYPEYLGWEGLEDQLVQVVGTQASLPMETQFKLNVSSNKPLVKVHVRTPSMSITFGFEGGKSLSPVETTLTLQDEDGASGKRITIDLPAETLFNDSRTSFSLPLLVTANAEVDRTQTPIAIPPDTNLQIDLEDEDQIYSPESTSVTITGIVDEDPVVDTRRTGIGTAITRMASIPIQGRLLDDYGVTDAWFGYRLNESGDEATQPLAILPSGQREFPLGDGAEIAVERFNLIPLKLEEGDEINLGVYAQDGDVLNGPHISHGEIFSFKIVSKDELLAKLNDREINLRLRFEQIESEIKDLRTLLVNQREAAASPQDNANSLNAFVERSLHQLRKNHTESRSVEVGFENLREEMVNNRVDTKELLERIDDGVITPLHELNEDAFLEADRKFGVLRLAIQQQGEVLAATEETIPAVDAVLDQMARILAEMRDRGTFNDLIQNLQSIIERQEQLLEKTEEKRIEENFFFDN